MAFFDTYMTEFQNINFEDLCGVTYEEDIYECASDGGHVSVWVMAGLSSVLQRPIYSIYPAVNGNDDRVAEILNRRLNPRNNYDDTLEPIHIMWTRMGPPADGAMWITNHFVPLVRLPDTTMSQNLEGSNYPSTVDQSLAAAMQSSHFNRPWETAAAQPLISPPIAAPRTLATKLSTLPRAAPRTASPCEISSVVSSASPHLVEAHKGGTRLILDGYMYVRDRTRKDKT
jgi:hypothetical protein